MSMTVMKPLYRRGTGGNVVGGRTSAHSKYIATSANPWMGGRGTARGPQYTQIGGSRYLRRGMGAGPTRQWGRSQTGSGRYGKQIMGPQEAAKLGYSTSYRNVLSRTRYPGVAYRAHGVGTLGDLVPGQHRTDIRSPIDLRMRRRFARPTIYTRNRIAGV